MVFAKNIRKAPAATAIAAIAVIIFLFNEPPGVVAEDTNALVAKGTPVAASQAGKRSRSIADVNSKIAAALREGDTDLEHIPSIGEADEAAIQVSQDSDAETQDNIEKAKKLLASAQITNDSVRAELTAKQQGTPAEAQSIELVEAETSFEEQVAPPKAAEATLLLAQQAAPSKKASDATGAKKAKPQAAKPAKTAAKAAGKKPAPANAAPATAKTASAKKPADSPKAAKAAVTKTAVKKAVSAAKPAAASSPPAKAAAAKPATAKAANTKAKPAAAPGANSIAKLEATVSKLAKENPQAANHHLSGAVAKLPEAIREAKQEDQEAKDDEQMHLKEKMMDKHTKVVELQLKARQLYEHSKLKNQLREVSEETEVQTELPRKMLGLKDQPAVGDIQGHPFREVRAVRANKKYNTMRHKVIKLTHRLASLEKEAADSVAKEKYERDLRIAEQKPEQSKARIKDTMDLAGKPEKYKNRVLSIQEELMKSANLSLKQEKNKLLKKKEIAAENKVKADERKIAFEKRKLSGMLEGQFAPMASGMDVKMSQPMVLEEESADSEPSTIVPESHTPTDAMSAKMVRMLAKQVNLLEQQQSHMVEAFASHLRTAD